MIGYHYKILGKLLSLRPRTRLLLYSRNGEFNSLEGQNDAPYSVLSKVWDKCVPFEVIVGKLVLGIVLLAPEDNKDKRLMFADVVVGAGIVVGVGIVVVVVCVFAVVVVGDVSICWEITLPSLSTIIVLVITAGTLI